MAIVSSSCRKGAEAYTEVIFEYLRCTSFHDRQVVVRRVLRIPSTARWCYGNVSVRCRSIFLPRSIFTGDAVPSTSVYGKKGRDGWAMVSDDSATDG